MSPWSFAPFNDVPVFKVLLIHTMKRCIYMLMCLHFLPVQALACTNEVARVCGYWTHTAKTETFQNECKMREHGAQLRHTGSCAYAPPKNSLPSATSKSGK